VVHPLQWKDKIAARAIHGRQQSAVNRLAESLGGISGSTMVTGVLLGVVKCPAE